MQLVFLDRFHNVPDVAENTLRYPHVQFTRNTWNDYGFETLFLAEMYLSPEDSVRLGGIKIGTFAQTANDPPMRSVLTGVLPQLPETHFSLGQDARYYDVLQSLGVDIIQDYAASVRDIPILDIPTDLLEEEAVFRVSLLRSGMAHQALDHGRNLFGRRSEVVDRFTFETRIASTGDHIVPFNFQPHEGLPHRMNVLVGVNGVGKTQLMANLAIALSRFEEEETQIARKAAGETFEAVGRLEPRPSFYGVITVSFSAFDDFEIPKPSEVKNFAYVYCGIRNRDKTLSSVDELARRITGAIRRMNEAQRGLFDAVLQMVLPQLALGELPTGVAFYKSLSAGQRIVLNIVSELVLNLRKRSLVLLDEPETHLHPQLITTLISALSEILNEMDAFAIVATHSPIVVQQVLANRVHVVHRIEGEEPLITSPPAETFGENLSEIVRLVFDANESDRDYLEVIDRLLLEHRGDAAAVRRIFGGRLGFNAELYLNSLQADAQ